MRSLRLAATVYSNLFSYHYYLLAEVVDKCMRPLRLAHSVL